MYIIDRFEGEYALIRKKGAKKLFHIPKELMPKGAKEGDVVIINISVDAAATASPRKSGE
ncbi:MAG: DUF3006 domain-containing protein [Bacillota bacterium]